MAKAIPHNADTDESYEAEPDMTDADGNTYYERKVPTPPVVIDRGKVTYKRPNGSTSTAGRTSA